MIIIKWWQNKNIAECLKILILVIPTLGLKQKGYEHEIKQYKTKQQSSKSSYMIYDSNKY